jgi:hypothetical protein
MLLEHGYFKTVYQKLLERFKVWCWKRLEKTSWKDRVKNEVLGRIKEERNTFYTIKRRKANRLGHILPIKHVIEKKERRKDRSDVTTR